ncbi:Uncharacterised protein [Listeria newyorkensis]|nr:Uncharacterised protein [Listeria newyorkensis]
MQQNKTWGKIALGLLLLLLALSMSTSKVSAAETTDWTKVTWTDCHGGQFDNREQYTGNETVF